MFPEDNNVSASLTTLMRQAPDTVATYMRAAVTAIDEQFGKGYAKDHPELVGAFIQVSALDFHTCLLKVAAQDLGGDLNSVSMSIEALATAVCA